MPCLPFLQGFTESQKEQFRELSSEDNKKCGAVSFMVIIPVVRI